MESLQVWLIGSFAQFEVDLRPVFFFIFNNNTGFVPTGSSRQEEDEEGEEGGDGTVGRGGGKKKKTQRGDEREDLGLNGTSGAPFANSFVKLRDYSIKTAPQNSQQGLDVSLVLPLTDPETSSHCQSNVPPVLLKVQTRHTVV